MTTASPWCPQCGTPIIDTAYVCDDCQTRLAAALREAADAWEHIQDAVGRNVAVETVARRGVQRREPVGPSCEREACDHESCTQVWAARVRGRREAPLPHENLGPVDWSASEKAWVARNTVDAWTTYVADRRGSLPKPRRRLARQTFPAPRAKTARCEFSDLPVGQCACGRQHTIEPSCG